MSARSEARRLSGEDLDVLISRSLDGDLSPEDQSLLDEVLLSDPKAAARRDELAGVVAALHALPAPGAPLGMSARVASATAVRASGLGGVWSRLGVFPPPATVRGIAAVFAIVVIGISVMRSQSERTMRLEKEEAAAAAKAGRSDGAVAVFFEEKKPEVEEEAASAPAAQPAHAAPAAPAAPAVKLAQKPAEAPPVVPKDSDTPARAADAGVSYGRTEVLEKRQQAVSSNIASIHDEADSKKAKVSREMSAQVAVGQAPVQAPAAVAPAPPLPPPLGWSVSVLDPPGWVLKKAPDTVPGRLFATRCVVSVDASGRVVSVRPSGAPLPKEVDDFVRGLVFEPAASGKAQASADVEIEVRAR